ncbi:peptidoglycan-binding protein [Candidatus Kaiserbacteria bacterium]|nr:peptidoglycan-binding protein [Candidatus Kaiserbacteria bacterium]USN92423.1 MAG: peptidoglycan-binding protein [Candidatus Nomurabacteria bacterium]
MNTSASFRTNLIFISLVLITLFALPSLSLAQSDCAFDKTLEIGVIDESVRCLQEYLNTNGYKLTSEGPGSPGSETDKYGSLTREAVAKWQKDNGVSPAVGIFGPVSQAKYKELAGGPIASVAETERDRLLSILSDLQAQVDGGLKETNSKPTILNTVSTPKPQVAGVSTSANDENREEVEVILKDVIKMIKDAEAQIDDLENEKKQTKLKDDLADARSDFYVALESYFDEDYEDALDSANDALDSAGDVFEDAGGETDESKAKDTLRSVEDLLEEVQDLFNEAEDEGEDVGDAEDMIEEAIDLLSDANDSYDKRVYRQAISDALDAEELLEDARDEIDIVSDKNAESYVEDVRDKLYDAEEEIQDAEDEDEEVEDAWDLFNDAERKIKKADIAIDEEDYKGANKLAKDAEDLIEEALDAIGGSGDGESDAEEALSDAWDEYKDARDEVEEADDEGDDVGDAYDYLKDAKSALKDAEDAFDEEDWDEVMDLVEEAERAIEDALDEL